LINLKKSASDEQLFK